MSDNTFTTNLNLPVLADNTRGDLDAVGAHVFHGAGYLKHMSGVRAVNDTLQDVGLCGQLPDPLQN